MVLAPVNNSLYPSCVFVFGVGVAAIALTDTIAEDKSTELFDQTDLKIWMNHGIEIDRGIHVGEHRTGLIRIIHRVRGIGNVIELDCFKSEGREGACD